MFTPVKIVRFWLPALIFLVGLGMLVISPDIVGLEGAALMLGGGLGVVISNRIHQMGLRSEKDRDMEMGARAFYAKYGVWPDEASEELLDRAEREGDIEPRPEPEPDPPVPASPALPPRVDPHDRASSKPVAGSSKRGDDANGDASRGGNPSAPSESRNPPRPTPGAHPHAGTRRAGGIAARRRPRR